MRLMIKTVNDRPVVTLGDKELDFNWIQLHIDRNTLLMTIEAPVDLVFEQEIKWKK